MAIAINESKSGIFALMLAHCAGMVDLVALPVWVGTLVAFYKFDPQGAGGLPTAFLIGASIASLTIAPRLNRLSARRVAIAGFALAALLLFVCATVRDYGALLGLHLLGGMAVGSALSVTHGTIGHSSNPHRLFGLSGLAVGLLGIVFLGGAPGVIAHFGGQALFLLLGGLMSLAALVALLFFPARKNVIADLAGGGAAFSREIWFCIAGIALLCTAQSMTLSFYERLGIERGFGADMVTLALVAYGIVAVFPSPLAALLEKRLSATAVICIGPLFQALFAMLATHTGTYWIYACAGAMMAFTILFTHTFAFGLLARLDPSGRAVAGTPAMLMVGAAIGPFLGGTLVKFLGFEAIGLAACALVMLQVVLFNATRLGLRQRTIEQGVLPISAA